MHRPLTPVLFAVLLTGNLVPAAEPDVTGSPNLPAFGKHYRIDIVSQSVRFPVKTTHGDITGSEAPARDAGSYASLFVCEWSMYPRELVKKTGLRCVVFCKDLSFAGQPRTAIPDFEHDTLYLDVTRGRHDENYVRKVIHHEFFHIVDLKDDGRVYEDERWGRLNPPGFRYGPGGAKFQNDPTATTTGKDLPGFMNRYATAGVEEDKAEMFAHMMVEPQRVAARIEADKYVRAKVERMREIMAAFSPQAGDDFWTAVIKAERPVSKK